VGGGLSSSKIKGNVGNVRVKKKLIALKKAKERE